MNRAVALSTRRTSVSGRTRAAVAAGTLAGRASRLLGRGQGGTIVGRVVLRLAPQALHELTQGRTVVLVSGTNGKTTTTAFVAAALRTAGPVVTNTGGDNLLAGLTSALAGTARDSTSRVVLEVDEIFLARAIEQTQPSTVVLLNLSRDQLDRTGEVMGHVLRWAEALARVPEVVIVANADDPLIAAVVLKARPDHERVIWVAAGNAWRDDARLCVMCGHLLDDGVDYTCPQCGFGRPSPSWSIDVDGLHQAAEDPGAHWPLELALPGRANRGNAAIAVAAAAASGVPPETALAAIQTIAVVSGRYLRASVRGRDLQFLLAKNPAGWTELLDVLAERETPVIVSINARSADGVDPSWLWDAPFERLRGRTVVATGERRWDLAVRLTYAEVPHTVAEDVVAAIDLIDPGPCDLVANYTAFHEAHRRVLGQRVSSERSA